MVGSGTGLQSHPQLSAPRRQAAAAARGLARRGLPPRHAGSAKAAWQAWRPARGEEDVTERTFFRSLKLVPFFLPAGAEDRSTTTASWRPGKRGARVGQQNGQGVMAGHSSAHTRTDAHGIANEAGAALAHACDPLVACYSSCEG